MPRSRHGRSSSYGNTNLSAYSPSAASTVTNSNTSSYHTRDDVADGQTRRFACPFCKLHPFEWLMDTNKDDRCSFYYREESDQLKNMIRHHVIELHRDINRRLPIEDIRKVDDRVFVDLKQWFSNKERHQKRWIGEEAVTSWTHVFNTISNGRLYARPGDVNDQTDISHNNPFITEEWLIEIVRARTEQISGQINYLDPTSEIQTHVLERAVNLVIENANLAKEYMKEVYGHFKQHCRNTLKRIDWNRDRHIRRLRRDWPMLWNASKMRSSRTRHQTNQDVHGVGGAFSEKFPYHSPQSGNTGQFPVFGHPDDITQFEIDLGSQRDSHQKLGSQDQSNNTYTIPIVRIDGVETASATNSMTSNDSLHTRQHLFLQQQVQPDSEPIKRSVSFSGISRPQYIDTNHIQIPFRNSFDQPQTSNLLSTAWQPSNMVPNQHDVGRQPAPFYPFCNVCQSFHDLGSPCILS